jgi:hypothetical protein
MQRINELCAQLHAWANSLPVHTFPFDINLLPKNGIYLLFERGEFAHGANRIVRIGTHTGQDQLRSRLQQHFLTENKDRSIFRKNIGRAILRRAHDPFLVDWELDLTTAEAKAQHSARINGEQLRQTERQVSLYMQANFSFVAIEVLDKEKRLQLESRMISTVSLCSECRPSASWLGNYSPKDKIRKSGLWLVNELYKEPLERSDIVKLAKATGGLPHTRHRRRVRA